MLKKIKSFRYKKEVIIFAVLLILVCSVTLLKDYQSQPKYTSVGGEQLESEYFTDNFDDIGYLDTTHKDSANRVNDMIDMTPVNRGEEEDVPEAIYTPPTTGERSNNVVETYVNENNYITLIQHYINGSLQGNEEEAFTPEFLNPNYDLFGDWYDELVADGITKYTGNYKKQEVVIHSKSGKSVTIRYKLDGNGRIAEFEFL